MFLTSTKQNSATITLDRKPTSPTLEPLTRLITNTPLWCSNFVATNSQTRLISFGSVEAIPPKQPSIQLLIAYHFN